MRTKLIFTLFVVLPGLLLAQNLRRVVPTSENITNFFANTTMVVIPENDFLLEATFRKAVEESWTITPYKFITYKEFETMRGDAEQAFLMIFSGIYAKDKAQNEYIYMGLLMGCKEGTLNGMPEFIMLPVGGTVNESENQYDMFGIFADVVQHHMRNLKANPASARRTLSVLYGGGTNIKSLKGKTLLISEENFAEPTTQEDMDKLFSQQLQLASYDEIADVIEERAANTVIGYVVYPDSQQSKGSYCYKMLLSADSGELIYYREQRVGGLLGYSKRNSGFLKGEVQSFSNAYK